MKLLKIALLLFITAGFMEAQAQSLDEIINKHLEAIGGKEKISGLKTIYMEGEMDIMSNKAPSVTYIINDKGYKNEVDFNGTKIITVYTNKGGWTINPMAGQTVATPVSDDVLKTGQLQLDAAGPLFNYASKGNKIELEGRDGGTYKLNVTTQSNVKIDFYIDTTSYNIVKTVTSMTVNGQEIKMSVENSDFKKTDYGLIMPFSAKLDFPGLTITTNSNKIEINKEIDEAIFKMPENK